MASFKHMDSLYHNYLKENAERCRVIYLVNGWGESKPLVKSLGITNNDIRKMLNGNIITKGDNEFSIQVVDEQGHECKLPDEVPDEIFSKEISI